MPFAEGKLVPVPGHLQKYVRDWLSISQCREYAFGHVLIQLFENIHYNIHHLVFDLQAPAVIVFTEEKPVVTMHFMLQGQISSVLHGQEAPTLFAAHTFRPVYSPAGSNVSSFHTGLTESMQFEFNHHYPELFSKEFETLEELALRLLQPSDALLTLPALPITYQVSDTIRQELFTLENDGDLLDQQKYIIYKLFWHYHHAYTKQQGQAAEDPGGYKQVVQQIKEEIRRAPNKELQTNTYFSKKHHITEPTLRRVFKAISGTTLPEFRQEQCMRKAVHLLAGGRLNLEEIAAEIGYGSKSSLSIALKSFEQKSKLK
jgi:AraC-like DNA-binding protein